MIHSTAVIHATAKIHPNVFIGPSCYIGPGVSIAEGVHIEPFCSIGAPPEHTSFWKSKNKYDFPVIIEPNVMIRSHVTVDSGTERNTLIGHDSYLLTKSHVGHDCIVEPYCGIGVGAFIGGFTVVGRGSVFGLNSSAHQRLIIPEYTMVGMNSCITKKCEMKPFQKWGGVPAKFLGENTVAKDKVKK